MQGVIIALTVIAFFCIAFFAVINLKKKSKEDTTEGGHFSQIYSAGDYAITDHESKLSGKVNSPFISNRKTIEKLKNGTTFINKLGNMYEGVGDCDERPQWQQLS